MFIDIAIAVMLVIIIFRGREIGMVRQVFSAVGFGLGMFLGVLLQPYAVNIADTTLSRALLSFVVIFGGALFFLGIAEGIGVLVKRKLQYKMTIDKLDAVLGSIVGAVSFLVGIWLIYPLLSGLPDPGLQQALRKSTILSSLNHNLPAAPKVLSGIDHIINPNGFPDVFAGLEHAPTQPDAPLPNLGDLQAAVQKTRASVVKVQGRGCGGVVEGSGYVAAKGTIITNAHVVAGVEKPTVIDGAGEHQARAIWFDPDLDVAILRVDGLTGEPLVTDTNRSENGTPAAVVGFPGGGGFTAKPASILDQFTATGRNIYGQGATSRSVYEIKADVIPGNSGGPLINKNGTVIGLIFAQSTTYQQIGYALTMQAVVADLQSATQQNQTVTTGQCAE